MDLSLHTSAIETVAFCVTSGGGLTGLFIYVLRQVRKPRPPKEPPKVLPPPEARPLITDRSDR
jgi:hypothetical protein